MRQVINVALLLALIVPAVVGQATPKGGVTFGQKPNDQRLDNPYNVPAGRPEIVKAVQQVLEEQEIALNADESRPADGLIVTNKIIFSRGTNAANDLVHFAAVPAREARNWSRARVGLTIRVTPIDPNRTQLFITGRFEGYSQTIGSPAEWVAATSNGRLEECFLEAILEKLGILTPQSKAAERDNCRLCLRGCG